MSYLVFLDIDGVFTSNRVFIAHNSTYGMWSRFDPIAVDFMNKIHDTYNVKFVIMSTWKNFIDYKDIGILHWVYSAFGNSGFRGQLADPWKTGYDDVNKFTSWDRAFEVKHYLDCYSDQVIDYILFDDRDVGFNKVLGKKRLILTDKDNGLLSKHMLNAQAIMGDWDKK